MALLTVKVLKDRPKSGEVSMTGKEFLVDPMEGLEKTCREEKKNLEAIKRD